MGADTMGSAIMINTTTRSLLIIPALDLSPPGIDQEIERELELARLAITRAQRFIDQVSRGAPE